MPWTSRYSRIFTYGSSQFCGHIEAYWAAHTEDLLVYVVEPRISPHQNVIRIYHRGALVREYPVRSSRWVVGYYSWWYMNHLRALLRFAKHPNQTLVLGSHPIAFVGMSLIKWIRPVVYAYWIGDYFTDTRRIVVWFERVKKCYHDRVSFAFYLSDSINRVMNGHVAACPSRRTVMWGLKAYPDQAAPPPAPFTLLFVGLIRPGQGIEAILDFLATHEGFRLNLIGVGQPVFVKQLQEWITKQQLGNKVFFPNRFYSEEELVSVARTCHVGVALYDHSPGNFSHYADPGKVKAYAEMHLPVLITRVSDIVPFVERFGSGEVIGAVDEIQTALERMQNHYLRYQEGVRHFISCFEYERYYQEAFVVLENI
ncbi:MAG: glycosyltransferase family 4 protein [Lentisphaerae bacterium]|nr:glycosyltransferase family 4 protein [Lentisphaerota bacterium]